MGRPMRPALVAVRTRLLLLGAAAAAAIAAISLPLTATVMTMCQTCCLRPATVVGRGREGGPLGTGWLPVGAHMHRRAEGPAWSEEARCPYVLPLCA
jgi:hypothetical protein